MIGLGADVGGDRLGVGRGVLLNLLCLGLGLGDGLLTGLLPSATRFLAASASASWVRTVS